MEKKDTDYFIQKSRSIHGDKYDYSKSVYSGSHSKIEIICKIHGSFIQTVSDHYAGNGCSMCNGLNTEILTHNEFCECVKKRLPNINVIGVYRGTKYKILVEDENGLKYNIVAQMLLRGNNPTIEAAVNKSDIFKFRSNIVHKGKYDYSRSVYVNAKTPLKISCPEHGEFKQRASVHLKGSGCPKCARLLIKKALQKRPMDWTLSGWIESAESSSSFDSYKVYIIEIFNRDERFIKIGRTYRSVKNRFYDKQQLPYEYKIIAEISDNPHRIFKLERKLHKIVKSFKYLPRVKFHGMYECFTPDCLELLKDYINKE